MIQSKNLNKPYLATWLPGYQINFNDIGIVKEFKQTIAGNQVTWLPCISKQNIAGYQAIWLLDK